MSAPTIDAVTPENTKVDVTTKLQDLLDAYRATDKNMYKPLASTIHHYVPFSDQMGTAEISTVGLYFMNHFGTPFDHTVDAEEYMSKAVDPIIGHDIHTTLLLLNNEYDIALQFDGRADRQQREQIIDELKDKGLGEFNHSFYTSWSEMDRHMEELNTLKEALDSALT